MKTKMVTDIDLTSKAWCDLVFEGKNKKYGAYFLRLNSSNRHLKALLIVAALTLVTSILLASVKGNDELKYYEGDPIGPTILTEFQPLPVEVEKPEPIVYDAPKYVSSDKFTPPVIKPDDLVDSKDELMTQAAMSASGNAIGTMNVVGSPEGTEIATAPVVEVPVEVEKVFVHVEQMPTFPGGDGELMKFLGEKIKYPVIAQEQGIQGTVVLRFVINKDGSVSDVEVMRSLDPSCDKEAIRIVKSMPNWVPGKQNGNPVLVYFTLPVRFRLAS